MRKAISILVHLVFFALTLVSFFIIDYYDYYYEQITHSFAVYSTWKRLLLRMCTFSVALCWDVATHTLKIKKGKHDKRCITYHILFLGTQILNLLLCAIRVVLIFKMLHVGESQRIVFENIELALSIINAVNLGVFAAFAKYGETKKWYIAFSSLEKMKFL